MHDGYQLPALFLTILLVPAFGQLYRRNRDTRNLLWFLAFLLVVLRNLVLYATHSQGFTPHPSPWPLATGQALAMLASGFFLASLSPLSFRIGKLRVLYVIPFILPLTLYPLLFHAMFQGETPRSPLFWVLPALALFSVVVGLFWGNERGSLPPVVGVAVCLLFGGTALWLYFHLGPRWPLVLAESGNHIMTALLVISVFRRFSPGVVVAVLGFTLWSLPVLNLFPAISGSPYAILLTRLIFMAKVATALGLIFIALENELEANQNESRRERRIRKELEAYHGLILSRRRVEELDRQAPEICQAITSTSCFSQAALLLLQPTGIYRLAGSSGLDAATARALDALVLRITAPEFLTSASSEQVVEGSQTVRLDLHTWLNPGDDLHRLDFTSAFAVPLQGRTSVEGALLLRRPRHGSNREALRRDDLVPVEMLATRLQSVRSQTRMLEKLIDSEKFAGLGQLAGTVTEQLNNPLTVILGYASLLDESHALDHQERRGVEAILDAARTMRATLETLQRIARTQGGDLTAVCVSELIADLERLHRSEFLQRAIDLNVKIGPNLPRVLCQAQQIRQAVLHCLQFAIEAVEHVDSRGDRSVLLEGRTEGNLVKIVVAHTGPGFPHPEHAFDPMTQGQRGLGGAAGLGLSLCASILRENAGRASAQNLDPCGAAIVLELQTA